MEGSMIKARNGDRLYSINRPLAAFLGGAAIAILGGLIGLGGAEFRLPLLISVFALYPHRAVRINLLISLSTLAFSAVSRFGFTQTVSLEHYAPIIVGMILGGMTSAWVGAGLLTTIPKKHVSKIVAAFLLLVAVILALEAVFPLSPSGGIPMPFIVEIVMAVAAGIVIGAVSSLLGVAGGEFIIPVLVLIFGADIKTAGTASILISTPLVVTGLVRHVLGGKFRSQTLLARLVIPMSAGSIIGALMGGYAAQWVSGDILKGVLAAILIASSVKLFRSH
jgi:uncharacterized membrane protein YfcA